MYSKLYNDIFYLCALVGTATQDSELVRAINSVLPGGSAYTLPETQKIIYLFEDLESAVHRPANSFIWIDLSSFKSLVSDLKKIECKKVFS